MENGLVSTYYWIIQSLQNQIKYGYYTSPTCPKIVSGGCRLGYLCTWMDLFTRVIVSWSVDDNMQESLVRKPLEKALLKEKYSLD